jgi:lactate 2-monooxygenase
MPASLVSYVAGGCGDDSAQKANVAAFDKWGLWPRMFVGAKRRDLSIDLFGVRLPSAGRRGRTRAPRLRHGLRSSATR